MTPSTPRSSGRAIVPVALALLLAVTLATPPAHPQEALPSRIEGEESRPSAAGPGRDAAPDRSARGPADDPKRDPKRDPVGNQGREHDLGEIVVTARGTRPRDRLAPQALKIVDPETIARRAVLTTPDALEEEVGVVVQKTALGGGSPIIRGRTGKEILQLVDGQRFNNSTFRRNTQYLNTIDLNAIDSIEVIRGPASVLYGSDAMGGALNVITRRREPRGEDGLGGRLFEQIESADRAWMSHLGIDGEIAGWGFTGGFTTKSFDDLRAGRHGDPAGMADIDGHQVPTGYREHDASLSVSRRVNDRDTLDLLVLESRQNDVPRSDRVIPNDEQPDPPDLRRDYDPQVLRWYELRWRRRVPGETLESLTVTASFNNPREGRKRIKSRDPETLLLEDDEVTVPGLTARAGLRVSSRHLITTGIEGYLETVDSRARTRDLETGVVTEQASGRYPDGARTRSLGIYLQDEWTLAEDWRWTNGLRYSSIRVRLDLEGLQVGSLPPFGRLAETYDDVTFASSLAWDLSEATTLYGTISRGFRAPNLDDLAALGDFAAGNRVPNLALDPETVLNVEVGAKHQTPVFYAGASGAAAFFEDVFDNTFAFSEDGEDYFQVDNAARARLYSVESWVEAIVIEAAEGAPEQVVFAQAFFTLGRNESEREPLSKVPPPEATLGYRLEEQGGVWYAEAFVRAATAQDRLSTADREDPRIPHGGTPAWWTVNLRGGLDLARDLRLTASLENLLDQRYRVHGSGIDAPGFNAVLSLDWRF